MPSRRKALQVLSAATAAPVLAQHQHTEPLLQIAAAPALRFFTREEHTRLGALMDLIIPRTATPGASDARAHWLADADAARNAALGKRWKETLAWFQSQGSSAAEWEAALTRGSRETGTEAARHFKLLKDATIDYYYSTRDGLQTELGWNANTFLPEFKGCTHPEHQV
ncbi:MAG: gluconate 2-dehydrogenase subunit 3 family protein [Acidobacteria bacterium]|nr:gluconate 2-dehydrogenase subunit 3 family protein [Acidobacteriota bacterium]